MVIPLWVDFLTEKSKVVWPQHMHYFKLFTVLPNRINYCFPLWMDDLKVPAAGLTNPNLDKSNSLQFTENQFVVTPVRITLFVSSSSSSSSSSPFPPPYRPSPLSSLSFNSSYFPPPLPTPSCPSFIASSSHSSHSLFFIFAFLFLFIFSLSPSL
jgi:hypothetical protein